MKGLTIILAILYILFNYAEFGGQDMDEICYSLAKYERVECD